MSINYTKEYNIEIRNWLLDVFQFAEKLSKTKLHTRKCPVCESEVNIFYANNGYLDYVRCSVCDLIYMNPTYSLSEVDSGFYGEDKLLMKYFRIISKYKTPDTERPDPEVDNKLSDIYKYKKKR